MFRNVVVGLKPEQTAEQIIELALTVSASDAHLRLISVLEVGADTKENTYLERYRDALEALADRARVGDRVVEAEIEFSAHDAGFALVESAAEHGAELLIIGLGRRSRVGKALLGSSAQTVILNAPCPVLSARLR